MLDLKLPEPFTCHTAVAIADALGQRARRIGLDGFTPEDDDGLTYRQLAREAATYALLGSYPDEVRDRHRNFAELPPDSLIRQLWPWPVGDFTADIADQRHDLVKAIALLIAEVERLDRKSERKLGAP